MRFIRRDHVTRRIGNLGADELLQVLHGFDEDLYLADQFLYLISIQCRLRALSVLAEFSCRGLRLAAGARLAVLGFVLLGLQELCEGIVLLLKLLYLLFLRLEFLGSLLDLLDEDHVVSAALSELLVEALDLQVLASVTILTL